MPLFDRYLVVDWSAANTPKRGSDSIWIADLNHEGDGTLTNIPTRHEAVQLITDVIAATIRVSKRLFVGFDFGFGYPKGAAQRISGVCSWEALWGRIHELVSDHENNNSNRFAVGGELNIKYFPDIEGPFWGHPHQHAGRYKGLGSKRPTYTETMPEKRIVETVVKSAQPVWKLAYTGSVGSQTLLGISHLEAIRQIYPDVLSIWPFETGFSRDLSKPVVVAEVYPSLFPVHVENGEVKDSAQVRTLASVFQSLDAVDEFERLLAKPSMLDGVQLDAVLSEEGWIVGAGMSEPRLI